jgi:hypothetical protein
MLLRWGSAFVLAISLLAGPSVGLWMFGHHESAVLGLPAAVLASVLPVLVAVAAQPWLWTAGTRDSAGVTALTSEVGYWVLGVPATALWAFAACGHSRVEIAFWAGVATTTMTATVLLAGPRRARLCPLAVVPGAIVAFLVLTLLPSAVCET